jgi:hypothetical protein
MADSRFKPYKALTLVLSGLLLSFSAWADSSQLTDREIDQNPNPKQCLKELQPKDQTQEQAKDDSKQPDEEPSWFDKLVKQHKLGSLHFQDLLELFH